VCLGRMRKERRDARQPLPSFSNCARRPALRSLGARQRATLTPAGEQSHTASSLCLCLCLSSERALDANSEPKLLSPRSLSLCRGEGVYTRSCLSKEGSPCHTAAAAAPTTTTTSCLPARTALAADLIAPSISPTNARASTASTRRQRITSRALIPQPYSYTCSTTRLALLVNRSSRPPWTYAA
jgi:hypothetical protein